MHVVYVETERDGARHAIARDKADIHILELSRSPRPTPLYTWLGRWSVILGDVLRYLGRLHVVVGLTTWTLTHQSRIRQDGPEARSHGAFPK